MHGKNLDALCCQSCNLLAEMRDNLRLVAINQNHLFIWKVFDVHVRSNLA